MARTTSRRTSRARDPLTLLEQDATDRVTDLKLVFVRALTGERITEVGGRWDRTDEEFLDEPPEFCKVLRVSEAQLEATRAAAEWIAARREGRPRVAEIILEGGRGSGKTVLGVWLVWAIAIAFPDARCFLISTANTRRGELERIVRDSIPRRWWAWSERDFTYALPNGSTIGFLGADDEDALRQGGYEVALGNELQLYTVGAYATLAAGIRNVSGRPKGLFLGAMNPATKERGQWTEDHLDKIDAGGLNASHYKLDPRLNQFLESDVVDDVDALIRSASPEHADADALGIRRRLGERASPSFNPLPRDKGGHVGVPPEVGWSDVTARVSREKTGRDRGYIDVVGADFQKRPHCAGLRTRILRGPDGRNVYNPRDVILADGNEDDLAERLVDRDCDPRSTLIVADSSGNWQNTERIRNGRYSHDILREHGFGVVAPQRARTKGAAVGRNPDVDDSLAQLFDVCEEGRLLVDPACVWLIEALRKCKVKRSSGRIRLDDSRPGYSHIIDCLRYVIWYFEPRRRPAPTPSSTDFADALRSLKPFGGG